MQVTVVWRSDAFFNQPSVNNVDSRSIVTGYLLSAVLNLWRCFEIILILHNIVFFVKFISRNFCLCWQQCCEFWDLIFLYYTMFIYFVCYFLLYFILILFNFKQCIYVVLFSLDLVSPVFCDYFLWQYNLNRCLRLSLSYNIIL